MPPHSSRHTRSQDYERFAEAARIDLSYSLLVFAFALRLLPYSLSDVRRPIRSNAYQPCSLSHARSSTPRRTRLDRIGHDTHFQLMAQSYAGRLGLQRIKI